MTVKKISACRLCGSADLVEAVRLGEQRLTGVFVKQGSEQPIKSTLDLLYCNHCSFVQIAQSVGADVMYKEYWYRSGTNTTMRDHLRDIYQEILVNIDLHPGDTVIDIGCNDGTLLENFSENLTRVGVDPSNAIADIADVDGLIKINDYFSAEALKNAGINGQAKVITSISMFYDLDNPKSFVCDIEKMLSDDGVWVIEMNYTGKMIDNLGYDMISHEHVGYYTLLTFERALESTTLKVTDVSFNDINGGSIRIFVTKKGSFSNRVLAARAVEKEKSYNELDTYKELAKRMENHRGALVSFLSELAAQGKVIYAYGASTRGNTVLQYCDISTDLITCAVDRNPIKVGLEMAGGRIPIVSEEYARQNRPDYMLILPCYFAAEFFEREVDFLKAGGEFLIFLPQIKAVSWQDGVINQQIIWEE